MALDLQADLDIFFNTSEFAVSCTLPDSSIVKVLFDYPDQESFSSSIISSNSKITGKTTDLQGLAFGQEVTINSVVYTVKKAPNRIEDGLICEVELSRKLS